MQNKYQWREMTLISLPSLSLAAAYGLNPTIFHLVLNRFIDEGHLADGRLNTALGILGICGLIISALAQLGVGYLSDRTRTVIGRRYPYMIFGVALLILTLLTEIYAPNLWIFGVAVLFAYIALGAIQNPTFSLIPDMIPPQQMGLASGLKTVLEVVGIMVAGILGWAFLGDTDRPDLAVYTLWGLVALSVFLAVFFKRDDTPFKIKRSRRHRYVRLYASQTSRFVVTLELLRSTVRHIHRRQLFRWWLVHRVFLFTSFGILGKFTITYLEDVFGFSDSGARELQGQIVLLLSVVVFLAPIITGIISDRFSKRKIVMTAAIIAAVSTFFISQSRNLNFVIFMMSITGVCTAVLFAVGWALVSSTIPTRQAGFYMGITNIATSLGTIVALSLGAVVDIVNEQTQSTTQGYMVILVVAAIFYLLSALAIYQSHETVQIQLSPPPQPITSISS